MQTWILAVVQTWILAVVVAVVALAIAAGVVAAFMPGRRRARLRRRFGPEFDRTAHQLGGDKAAERQLRKRVAHRQALRVGSLDREAGARYAQSWRAAQARFVEDPNAAMHDADRVLASAARDRGYPAENVGQLLDDLSVDHSAQVAAYRRAREDEADSSTEGLRRAMAASRGLFEAVIGQSVEITSDQQQVTATERVGEQGGPAPHGA
jgi:hypothetical protein